MCSISLKHQAFVISQSFFKETFIMFLFKECVVCASSSPTHHWLEKSANVLLLQTDPDYWSNFQGIGKLPDAKIHELENLGSVLHC